MNIYMCVLQGNGWCVSKIQNYVGDPFLDDYKFDVELIEDALIEMKRSKAAGLDELTVEHVIHSHPVLIAILAKLFNIIMFAGYVQLHSTHPQGRYCQ